MKEDIRQLIPAICTWASKIQFSVKIYLFGSRINGVPHENSDLDIAIEFIGMREEERTRIWFKFDDSWNEQLVTILPYKPHLCIYEGVEELGSENFLTTKEHYLIFDSGNPLSEMEVKS